MKLNWQRGVIAGVAGTLAFDLVGLMAMGQFADVPQLLAAKLGAPVAAGFLTHYANGILLAILFAAVAPSLWGPRWVRSLTFFTVQTVFGVWLFMLPLAGAGALGLKMGAMMPMMSLIRHWVFAVVVALLLPAKEPVGQGQAARAGA